MFSQTLILSFSHSSFVALPKKYVNLLERQQARKKDSFTFDCTAVSVSLSWNICPVFPQSGAADFFPSHYFSSSSFLEAVTILFLLLLSLTLSALIQLFSLRLTAPEVNWKTSGELGWPLSPLRILKSHEQSQYLRHHILRPVCALQFLIQPRKLFTQSALLQAPGMMFV